MARKSEKVEGARFVRYFGPLLDALRNLGGSGRPSEVVEQIARNLNLSDEAQSELLDSGTPRFAKDVAFARFYLTHEGLLHSSRRGVWSLTDEGRSAHLTADQSRLIFLKWVKAFSERRKKKTDEEPPETENEVSGATVAAPPSHGEGLLDLLLTLPPEGFERLCQRLLRESGFTKVVVSGRGGDGGIDGYGTLQVNPLVSFKVLFQCKRYTKSVTPSQVRDFRGAMQGRADKGIILTTGTFTLDARKEASRDGVPPIELVDSTKLIDMFESLELGLTPVAAYQIDFSFFNEFRKPSTE